MRVDQLAPKKTVIRWSDAEWDMLAELVNAMRRNSPDSIATLANRAQKQFPRDRQRPGILTTVALQPLVERIQKMDRAIREKAEKCDEFAAKLTFFENVPTREQVLQSVTEEELRTHFVPGVLQMLAPADVLSAFPAEVLLEAIGTADLAGLAVKRMVRDMLNRPVNVSVQMPEQRHAASTNRIKNASGQVNGYANGKRKRVVVVGTKGDQPRHLHERVGSIVDLTCIEAEKLHANAMPRNADYYVLWSRFISHSHRQTVFAAIEPRKISEHFAGLSELGDFIEGLCGLTTVMRS